MASNDTKMFTVDKFLGINEAADGETELKMGEASKIENFYITDGFNLTLRPGIQRLDLGGRGLALILTSWAGYLGNAEYLLLCDFLDGVDRLFLYQKVTDGISLVVSQTGALGLTAATDTPPRVYTLSGKLYILSENKTLVYQDGTFQEEEPYVPLVITGASPDGGGTTLENLNLLTGKRRVEYSADGESTAYVLPTEAVAVESVTVDNVVQVSAGAYDQSTHTFTFASTPAKGVANVEITYSIDPTTARANRLQILKCPLCEAYNGATDTRLFVAGDGTNICYYSGVTQDGSPSATYFPAINEIAVDISSSPVTGLTRHYSKLLVFKPDGAFTITYESVTLTDGSTVAGFYLRSANRELGNDILGQVQTVNNYPRTVTKNGIYEWRITSSFYRDERYASRISDRIGVTLSNADVSKIVAFDDSFRSTYYLFLNDSQGTVLVNRYNLNKEGVWTVYTGALLKNIQSAFLFGKEMVFAGQQELFQFVDGNTMDAPEVSGEASTQIPATWESGYMAFGSDFLRKYSSYIYVSLLPESNGHLSITATTDRREAYTQKSATTNVFSFDNFNFENFTFDLNTAPKIQRIRLKVKKFVYYKLIFKIEVAGATATVLGFDQQVRFSSMAK